MIEIFNNIPDSVKHQTESVVNLALSQSDPMKALNIIDAYQKTCKNESEKNFVNFYFYMRLEMLKNENNIN